MPLRDLSRRVSHVLVSVLLPTIVLPAMGDGFRTVSRAQADIILNDYDPNVHNRFDDDRMGATFVGDGFDWSGVGRRVTNTGFANWATMISDRHFISANHSRPNVGTTVRFWENNLTSSPFHDFTVVSGQRVGSTDLWIGRLNNDVPNSITQYAIPADLISTLATDVGCLDSYANDAVFTVGIRGVNGFGIGQNRYDVGDSTSELNGSFTAIGFIDDVSGDTNFIDADESRLLGGDSGAPSFRSNGSSLELVGIHTYRTTEEVFSDSVGLSEILSCRTPESSLNTSTGRFISYDNFVPEYRNQVLAIAAVPEPPAWALLGFVFGSAFAWRSRRQWLPVIGAGV